MKIKEGARVQHRGWFWMGTIMETKKKCSPFDFILVQQDGHDKIVLQWIPALILNPYDFVYDWSEENEGTEDRETSESEEYWD